jgi:outer membrane protein TolC
MQNNYKLAKENLKTILCVDYDIDVIGKLEDFLNDEKTGNLLEKKFDFEELKKNINLLPEMRILDLQKRIFKNNLNMVRSEVFPAIVISGSYDWTVDDYNRPIEEWDDRYSWSVILTWPLFNGGSTFAKYKQAKENIKQIELSKQQAKEGFTLELTSLYSTYLQLKDSLSVAQDMVEQAKENYEVAKSYYLEGRSSYLELLQAELNFSNTKINYYQTLCDYIITCEKLKKYVR